MSVTKDGKKIFYCSHWIIVQWKARPKAQQNDATFETFSFSSFEAFSFPHILFHMGKDEDGEGRKGKKKTGKWWGNFKWIFHSTQWENSQVKINQAPFCRRKKRSIVMQNCETIFSLTFFLWWGVGEGRNLRLEAYSVLFYRGFFGLKNTRNVEWVSKREKKVTEGEPEETGTEDMMGN